MKTSVKKWYLNEYPEDDLGEEINGDINFIDMFTALNAKIKIYDFINVHDSLIRERIFAKMSELSGIPYGEIYDKWLSY